MKTMILLFLAVAAGAVISGCSVAGQCLETTGSVFNKAGSSIRRL